MVNGFQKKTQKTPIHEIRLALKLKKQYFSNK
ncbi:MAG: type II toxin-antitoxin system RelE/ParE family toxin [Sediminibacterium sp.]